MAFSLSQPPPRSASSAAAVEQIAAPVPLREPKLKIMFECIQDLFRKQFSTTTTLLSNITQWFLSVSSSIIILIGVPLAFYNIHPASTEHLEVSRLAKQVIIGWTSLLHISACLLLVIISFVGLLLAQKCYRSARCNATCASTTGLRRGFGMELWKRTRPLSSVALVTFGLGFAFAVSIALQSNLQMIRPSWAWNPFLWGGYRVYKPDTMSLAMNGLCVDYKQPLDVDLRSSPTTKKMRAGNSGDRSQTTSPLCLNESQWRELSTEALSPRSQEDVDAVLRGLNYAEHESGGIIISVMSRDTIDAIEPFRQNVEGILRFVSELSVVVFENDSSDGSRQAFYQWAKDVAGQYKVDVIECEVPECRFHEHHRDFSSGAKKPYAKTSAIGRMAEFRNRMVKHILEDPSYKVYTHMMVLDIDLGVSISPLGVLHTLGTLPNEAVASSGRQVWPGSFGTITPPYDFSAFQAHETEQNKRLLGLHKKFCNLRPKGDRWRNECNAVSPMHTMMVLGEDRLSDKPYIVDSAFNGATIYPIDLVRRTSAKYDVGDDGQRCEHIGFNLSLKQTMYVNPQWNMHVSPSAPGGPTGKRASQTIQGIASSPVVGPIIFILNMICMMMFVYAVMTLSMKVVYPFWVKMVTGVSFFDVANARGAEQRLKQLTSHIDAAISPDLESLLNPEIHLPPRKRKVSDFESP